MAVRVNWKNNGLEVHIVDEKSGKILQRFSSLQQDFRPVVLVSFIVAMAERITELEEKAKTVEQQWLDAILEEPWGRGSSQNQAAATSSSSTSVDSNQSAQNEMGY